MSQVRKLLQGNTVPKAESGYKFVLDNTEYNVTDEQLKEIDDQLSKISNSWIRQELPNWTTGIKSGEGFGNTLDNTVSRGMLRDDYKKGDENRLKNKKATTGEAMFQKRSWYAKQAIEQALRITKNVLNNKNSVEVDKGKSLGTNEIALDFNVDQNGNYYLSPINYGTAAKRVSDVLAHLQAGDNSEYDSTGWDFTNIQNWLQNSNDLQGDDKYTAANTYFSKLWTDMQNPGYVLSPDLEDLLANFKITKGNYGAASDYVQKTKTQSELEKEFPGLYEFVGDNVTKDKYGIWRLNPGATFDFGIPELTGKNIYFNDDFYNSRYAAGKHLDALRGLTFYDNAFYRKDSPELAQILNAEGFYNDMMRRGDWTSANDLIASLFTTGNRELPSAIKDNEYLKFLNRPGDRYASLTGAYTINGENLQPGQQLIQYLNLGEPDSDGPYTTYSYKYALLDANGNPVLDQNGNPMIDIPWDTIQEISGASAKPLRTSGRVVDENSPAYGYVYEDPTGRNNEASGIKIYQDPDSPSKNVILHIPNIKASGVDEGFDLKLPSDLAQILIENKETWLNNVLSNPKYRSQFESLISDLVRARTSQWNILPSMARNRFKNLGFKDEQLDKIVEAWQKARKSGNRNERRENMLVYAPSFNKDGGKIQYITKLATGGKSNNNKNSEVKTTKQYTNTKVANPNNPAGALQFGEYSNEDWMDLTALGADLASLGITIADPTNIGGMVSGVGSSLLRYKADKGRQEKGAGKQLAINLAMDAATLLPIIGDAASSAKLINSVRKALPTIIKLASVYGMSEAVVNSAKKIANGDKFTVRDVSIVANAITSGIAIGKSGGFGKSKTSSKVAKDISLTSNDGQSTITLSSKQVEKITTPDQLKSALYKEAKKSNPELTEAQFEEKFDISELLTNTTKRSLKKPKTWLKGENVSTFKPEMAPVTTPLSVNPQRGFYNWWHGLNRENMVFRGNVSGEQMNVNVPGRIKYRTDVVEAPGTTADANYYKDEFGTWYRIGNSSSRTATAAELQKAKSSPRRQAINNGSEFTGKVNVFEGIVNPTTSVHNYPTAGIVMPQYFSWNMYNEPQTYQTLPNTHKSGGTIKAQEGVSLNVKYPHYQRKYTENRTDGSVVGIIEEQDNLGNVTKKEVLLQAPPEKQEKVAVEQTIPIVEANDSNVEEKTSVVYPKRVNELKYLLNHISPRYEFTKMANVAGPKFILPTVHPTNQKIIQIKTKNGRTFNDLVSVLEQLSGNYKSGGIIKAQNGTSYNWTDEDDAWLQGYSDSVINDTLSSQNRYSVGDADSRGGIWKQKPDLTRGLIPALSLVRFGINSAYQKKFNRQGKAAIEAGRYHEQPVIMNAPDINSPALDRALHQNNQERQLGIKQVTSDWNSHNAAVNQRENQLWNREQSLIGQKSQHETEARREVLNIQNQNLLNRINTANANRARDAAIDSAKLQQDMILTQQRAQSFDNLGLEIQNNLMKDRQTMLSYNRAMMAQKLEDDYDREIDSIFPAGTRNKYNSLTPEQAMNYIDYDDYLRRNYPNEYAKNKVRIDQLQKDRINGMNTWMYKNTLNYRYPSFLLPSYKKGGKTNGTTRYTLDPDERIWVDNNKAAHAAIAKLNDNTIKLLLRALK